MCLVRGERHCWQLLSWGPYNGDSVEVIFLLFCSDVLWWVNKNSQNATYRAPPNRKKQKKKSRILDPSPKFKNLWLWHSTRLKRKWSPIPKHYFSRAIRRFGCHMVLLKWETNAHHVIAQNQVIYWIHVWLIAPIKCDRWTVKRKGENCGQWLEEGLL